MDQLPSSVNVTNVTFLYTPTFFESEEENINLVVLTTSGELLEISNKNIVASCNICKKIEGYAIIKICYTYGPKIKHYIVIANERLFAIKKSNKSELMCFHLLDNISEFSIEDKENLGVPQIIAFYVDKTRPSSVLKLSDLLMKSNITKSMMVSPALSKLYSHIHDMRMQIKTAENVLMEKRSLISRMTTDYMYIENEGATLHCFEELASVFGEKSSQRSKPKKFPFSLGKLWLRVCFDFWVIGVYVSNLLDMKVSDMELFVMDPDLRIEKTQFYTNKERVEPFSLMTDFKQLDFIPCLGHGYVIGVIKEPFFKQSSIHIACNLGFSYNKKKFEQIHIGTIEVSHVDILNSSYSSFNLNQEVPDVLSIFATSSQHSIKAKDVNEEWSCNLNALLSTLKFTKINKKYYLADHKKIISFGGVLLQIVNEQQSCTIHFYTRNFQDLCLYIQPFKYLPTEFSILKKGDTNDSTIFSSLFNEIRFCNNVIKTKLSERDTNKDSSEMISIPLEVTELNELVKLEGLTELNFSLLKECNI